MSRKNILSALMIAGVLTGGVGLASHANVNKQTSTNKVSNVRLMTNRVSSFGCVKNGNGNLVVTNANGKTVGYVTVGQMLRLGSSNGSTTKVTVEETGVTGYINNSNIDYIKSGVNDSLTRMNRRGMVINVSTDVHIRANATMDSSVLAEMTNNTNLTITGKQGDWYRVSVNGIKGFVFGAYIGEGNSISGGTVTIPEGVHYGSSSKGNRVVVNSQIINQANNGISSNISNNVPVAVNNNNGSHITNNENHTSTVNKNNTVVNNNNNNNDEHTAPVVNNNNNNTNHTTPVVNNNNNENNNHNIVNHNENNNHKVIQNNNNDNHNVAQNNNNDNHKVVQNNNNDNHKTAQNNNNNDNHKSVDNNGNHKTNQNNNKKVPSVKEMFNAYVANCNKVFLNESPANNSKHLETLSEGTKVEVIGSQGNWLKVKSGDLVGYIYKTYLSTTKPESVKNNKPEDIHTTPHSQKKTVVKHDDNTTPNKQEQHHDNKQEPAKPNNEQPNKQQHHDNNNKPNNEQHHDNVTPHKEQHHEQPNNEQHHDNVTPHHEQQHDNNTTPNKQEEHHEQSNNGQPKKEQPVIHQEHNDNNQPVNHNNDDNNKHEQPNKNQPVNHDDNNNHNQPVVPNNNQPINHEHQNNPSRPQQQTGVSDAELEQQALQQINEWRSMFNEKPLYICPEGQQAAEQLLKHDLETGNRLDQFIGNYGSDTAWSGASGEEGFKIAMSCFKESRPHFENLTNQINKNYGVGIAVSQANGQTLIIIMSNDNQNAPNNNSIPGLGI